MNIRNIRQSQGLALFGVVSILLLGNCALGGSSGTSSSSSTGATAFPDVVTPQLVSLPVNTTQTFTASTAAPSSNIVWNVVNSANAGGPGTPLVQTGGTTFFYTAPAVPPLYGAGSIYVPGTVTLTTYTGLQVKQTFIITAPSVTVGFESNPAIVSLGNLGYIYAYAVGNINGGLTFQVNGVTGGNATVGTIYLDTNPNATPGEYIYTAPATLPPTGNTLTITAISTADPTKTAAQTLTLH